MTDTITQFNTWHDWKPSYTPQPAFVVEAREAAARAWQRVSELSDQYEDGQTDGETVDAAIEIGRAHV